MIDKDKKALLDELASDLHMLVIQAIEHGAQQERMRTARVGFEVSCQQICMRVEKKLTPGEGQN